MYRARKNMDKVAEQLKRKVRASVSRIYVDKIALLSPSFDHRRLSSKAGTRFGSNNSRKSV